MFQTPLPLLFTSLLLVGLVVEGFVSRGLLKKSIQTRNLLKTLCLLYF